LIFKLLIDYYLVSIKIIDNGNQQRELLFDYQV